MQNSVIQIRRLSKEDAPELQKVLEAAPRYSLNVSGELQPKSAADEVFGALPEGFDSACKFVFGIELDSQIIGCIDVLRGFPKGNTAMLGLLLLSEKFQGRGKGRVAYLEFEKYILQWHEINRVRISVVLTNDEVLGF